MSHLTTAIPPCVSPGSDGVSTWSTDIARNPGGYEQRVGRRGYSLRKFNLGYQIRRQEHVYEVLSLFEACEGQVHTFPYRDRIDFKSSSPFNEPQSNDVLLGTGDGTTAAFQLRKGYTAGSTTVYRTILLPVSGTLLVEVAGVLKTEPTHYTVNYNTGIITFTGGNIPTAGQLVKAGFEFYTKVRFDTDELNISYEGFRVGSIPNIPLIEVRS